MENTLEKIYKASMRFLTPLTAEDTYAIIVQEAIKLVRAEYGSIFLEKDGAFERIYPYSTTSYKMKARKGFISKTFQSGMPVISDVKDVERIFPNIKKMGVKSIISVPLSYLNKTIGVLTVQSPYSNYFHRQEANALKLFSPMASLAIRKTQLYNETREALKTRDLFIAMAAHELRTPLTTINGYVQLLDNRLGEMKEPLCRWVKELSWESIRLTLLVNELLEVSRINTGKLQYVFREHSIKEIIERVILDFKFSNPDRELILRDELLIGWDIVVGDFDKLLQVFNNLLENAAKFSPVDTVLTIHLKCKHPNIVIDIVDQGEGIPKKELPRIFEGFFKGDENSSKGLGLGLFLCKNIIAEHNGLIKIVSKLGKGTKVEIYLPRTSVRKHIRI